MGILGDVVTVNRCNYQVIRSVAIGGFSKVYLVLGVEDRCEYILKHISAKNENEVKNAVREIKLLQFVNSCLGKGYEKREGVRQLNKLHDFGRNGFDFYLLLEYVEGLELYDFIQNYLLKDDLGIMKRNRIIRDLSLDILRGIEILHQFEMVHRDLKPENIIVVEDKVACRYRAVIIDFNLSCCINSSYLELQDDDPVYNGDLSLDSHQYYGQLVGTRQYISVESLTKNVLCFGDLKACDVWSFGVILYLMLFGIYPFNIGQNWDALLNYDSCYSGWKSRLKINYTPFNEIISSIFVSSDQRPTVSVLITSLENLLL